MTIRELIVNDLKATIPSLELRVDKLAELEAPRIILGKAQSRLEATRNGIQNNLKGYKFKGYQKYSGILDEEIIKQVDTKYQTYNNGKKPAVSIQTKSGWYIYVPFMEMLTKN